ncbi:MAG: DMT family transporter [Firmicutes bacterium]|nr:DMT family transporter [Bacillota bacterium]
MAYTGELISLGTALCWTFTVVGFEYAGKRVGSLPVNIIRLLFGFIFLGITLTIISGSFLPIDASSETWIWLILSGVVGLVIGDLFLFQAFVDVGGRISLLIYSIVPVISAALGLLFFNEILSFVELIGMVVTLTAIALVILWRGKKKNITHPHSTRGIIFAFIGAISQSVGLLLSKQGMGDYGAFASTQIRVMTAIVGFAIYITIRKQWKNVFLAFKDKTALKFILLGSIFGPFLGVSSSLLALKYIDMGISTTIAQLNVILIIPFSVILFKEKVNYKEIIAAVVAIMGAALLFIDFSNIF